MDSKIIERIRALLALAKSDNENEAMAAAKQAMRLMEKHRVSEAEVANAQRLMGEVPIVRGVVFTTSPSKVAWKIRLANLLAHANACQSYTAAQRAYTSWGDGQKNPAKHVQVIIGSDGDIEVVKAMFAWLVLTGEKLAHDGVRKREEPEYVTAAKWKKDFLYGFASGVDGQLRAAKQEVRREAQAAASASGATDGAGTSSAIVLLEKHEERVLATYKAIPGLKNMNLGPRSFTSGYDAGREAGKNLHLGASLPGAKKALTGLASLQDRNHQPAPGRNA